MILLYMDFTASSGFLVCSAQKLKHKEHAREIVKNSRIELLCIVSMMAAMLLSPHSHAAPMPPIGPVDIEGTIIDIYDVPAHTREGVPGMSGSAGRTRHIPAAQIISLVNVSGYDPESIWAWMRYPERHVYDGPPEDQELVLTVMGRTPRLSVGMRVRFVSFRMRGDEGGIWSRHEKVRVIARRTHRGFPRKITDHELLNILREERNPLIRLAAVARIIEPDVLLDIARSDSNRHVRRAATERITDREVLAEILDNDPDRAVRRSASNRLDGL